MASDLGHPKQVKYLIQDRLPAERLRSLTKKNPYSPDSLLQRSVIMKYPNTVNLDTLIERIRKDKRVLSVEKNEIYRLTATIPADPFYSNGNASNPAHYQWGLHALNFENAWDFSKGHAYLGALDTGIDTDHADLQENYKPHLSKHFLGSFNNATSDDNIEDTLGHGTHVSGILSATSDNNFGVAGSCWHCSLAMIKMQATNTNVSSALKIN